MFAVRSAEQHEGDEPPDHLHRGDAEERQGERRPVDAGRAEAEGGPRTAGVAEGHEQRQPDEQGLDG